MVVELYFQLHTIWVFLIKILSIPAKVKICKFLKNQSPYGNLLRKILLISSRYYLPVKVDNNQNKKEVSMAEPIFLNPNSYNNIKLILNELKKMLGIGEKKRMVVFWLQWTFVCNSK